MKRALILPLLLTACAEPRLSGVDYIITTPENIQAVACAWQKPRCNDVLGLAFSDLKPCVVIVPPYSAATDHVWRHENAHCLGMTHQEASR